MKNKRFKNWFYRSAILVGCLSAGAFCLPSSVSAFPIEEQKGFTYLRGLADEKELGSQRSVTIGTWNICGTFLSKKYGGVIHWQYRLPGIIEKVREEDPDVMIFQEVDDAEVGEALVTGLAGRYAHLFTHLGPNRIGAEGGCMVLSKYPIHSFTNTSFANNNPFLNRGFATLEIKAKAQDSVPFLRLVGTHIMYGYTPEEVVERELQVTQIREHLSSMEPCPTLIAGDLNIEREEPILSFLEHGYKGREATCMTTKLVRQWDPSAEGPEEEWIDQISLVKGSPGKIKARLVEAFDSKTLDAETALSDHHMLMGTYSF